MNMMTDVAHMSFSARLALRLPSDAMKIQAAAETSVGMFTL